MIDRRKLFSGLMVSTIIPFSSLEEGYAQKAVGKNENGEPRHNISSYRYQKWQDHFKSTKNGAILSDTSARCLHYWDEGKKIHKIYPTSVPLTPELTRTGYCKVIRKVVGPEWRPTKSMRERDPKLPKFMPPGPDNPLGSHALYLSWPNYRIHGTSDTRKIGRQSSSGCIGLYNEHIQELFSLVEIGTSVRLI
ncbi:MAG: L,D-transpeptidase [Paracoccaceae bacterium]|tara:strand:- start:2239 stop:2817 length:579 start_codon:yes stop_codon:yes gene_type:complete